MSYLTHATSTDVVYAGLSIPVHEYPYILRDNLFNLKSYLFGTFPFTSTSYEDDVVILSTSYNSDDHKNVNFFASSLIRAMYPLLMQKSFAIAGPVLILGLDDDSFITSVPRKVVDYCANIITFQGGFYNDIKRFHGSIQET